MAKFSRGIEKVLALAALDGNFKEKLLTDRKAALELCDVELTDTEQAVLIGIPPQQLRTAIDRIVAPREARRQFMKGAAAAAIALVLGGCTTPWSHDKEHFNKIRKEMEERGIEPDRKFFGIIVGEDNFKNKKLLE